MISFILDSSIPKKKFHCLYSQAMNILISHKFEDDKYIASYIQIIRKQSKTLRDL